MHKVPVTAVVPTRNRPQILAATLASLESQSVVPAELVVVDASEDSATREVVDGFHSRIRSTCDVRWVQATSCGAAAQRNQGVLLAGQPIVWFFDDDIVFQPECANRLWQALNSDQRLGGVNALILNQHYHVPGRISRTLFRMLHGRSETSYAGLVLGPAVNLLPEDREDLPKSSRCSG